MTTPIFVTETDEPPPWNDCTWSAALMLANKASGNAYPATRAEREELRAASGDQSPSNSGDAIRGLQARYGHKPDRAGAGGDIGRANVLDKLRSGWGASLGLSFPLLAPHLRRWSPNFQGGHRVYVERYDPATKRLWWMDPLGRGSYRGEWAYLAMFDAATWWGDSLLVAEDSWKEADMDIIGTDLDDKLVDLPAGTKVLNPDGSLRITIDTARNGVRSPGASVTVNGSPTRLIWYTRGADPTLLLAVYASAAKNIRQDPEAASGAAERARWLTWKETYPK